MICQARPARIKFASLYSGCGGMDLGFMNAGLAPFASFELDQDALKTFTANVHSNVHRIDLSSWDASLTSEVAKCDVLIAGPPCQGFSTVGKNNSGDLRNGHLVNVAKIAAAAKPKIVIIENVLGLLSKKHSVLFEQTLEVLSSSGYSVSWDVHKTSDYGIAQQRKRVIILATLGRQKFELKLKCAERVNLAQTLKNVELVEDKPKRPLKVGSIEHQIAGRIHPGQKLSNVRGGPRSVHTWEIPEVFGPVSREEISYLETIVKLRRQKRRRENGDADPVDERFMEEYFGDQSKMISKSLLEKGYLRRIGEYVDLTNSFNGKFRRLSWDDVAPTVDTRFGQPRYFLHPSENRGFSMREAARVQSFPDTFKFEGSESSIYRMIGNAVPPKFGEVIAEDVLRIWNEM
ncbi:DNA (cytosine-5)-methyltransferase 1 [Parasphingorhabdus marina DSM 22363]|uniref:Cytosine-specific methyltransferase n=1 Tax=Parasphingorhabdus marina DSM 22363 TaxID=1123272 RepID=A0A1N6D4J6_9SPHN|nr:DNA cytosine methyltransferase [Parasphingorhabdus marina]SIN65760.1 DNA (cytosine-5)-methyltransferase 1 [Parasphingorhabdus marina DSM 22363]